MWGGRGSAKSWSVARLLLLKGKEKPLRILCTRELQKSIKNSVHKLLRNQILLLKLEYFYETNESQIKGRNGTEFIFLGTRHNPEEIKSTEGVDICWIEEGENLTEASWDIIDPTIRKDGSEVWVTFNTRFKFDYLYQLFVANKPPPGSWVRRVNHDDNPHFNKILQQQMKNMKERDYEKYLHIWEGELKQLAEGAIYGEQIIEAKKQSRVTTIFPEKSTEVHTFWDLGRNDHTAIWFMQNVGKEYRFIDYYENRLKDIDHYCHVLKNKGYLYGTHYMPHDVGHQMLGMPRPRQKQFEDGGVKPIKKVERTKNINQGIEAVRDIFQHCYFDKERCERGIEVLSNYRYQYNDDRDSYNLTPYHDWASNGSDAFRTFAEGYLPETDHTDYRKQADFRGSSSWMT